MRKQAKMPKSLKPRVIGILASLVVIGLFGFVYLTFQIRGYQYRYVECDPEQLLEDLKRISHVNVPENIQNVRAAKTIPVESDILFIIKFTCHHDVLNSFLESFPKEPLKIELEPYKPASDLRKQGFWTPPRWFTEVIVQGKMSQLLLDKRWANIYVDTTSEQHLIVYIRGFYPKNSE